MLVRALIEKGFFHLISANFLAQLLGFATILLVGKFLTPVELGEIKILQSYAAVFSVLAVFGLNASVLKLCSEKRDISEREHILQRAFFRATLATLLTLALLAALALSGLLTSSASLSHWLMIYALVIPFTVATNLLAVFLQALKRIKSMARALALIKLQAFVVIVASTWAWGFSGFVFSTIAASMIGLVPLFRRVTLRFLHVATSAPLPLEFPQLAKFTVLVEILTAIGLYGDIFILDHFVADRAAIGFYSLAAIFALGAMQITVTVKQIATPYFSEKSHDAVWFRKKLIQTQLRMTALSVLTAAGVFGMAVLLIRYFYGAEYQSVLTYLAILLVKYIVWSSFAIAGVALLGLGLVRYNLIAAAISIPIGLLLTYSLLLRMGLTGAAWGQTISVVVNGVLIWGLTRRAIRRIGTSRAPD